MATPYCVRLNTCVSPAHTPTSSLSMVPSPSAQAAPRLEYASSLRADRVARACEPLVVVSGIARALVRLHGNGIIHRDLKARNVLVASDNRPMLIDFGLACHTGLDPPEWVCRTVGTKKYRPPEMRDGRPAHPSMDMFCFGLLIEKLLKQRRERGSDEAAPAERGDEASRRGDEASRRERDSERGDEASRRGDEASRRGDDTSRRGDDTSRRGDEASRRGDERRERDGARLETTRDGGRDGTEAARGERETARERGSVRYEEGKHERRAARLLAEMATECTSREPQDRPTAWAALMRLQRFMGDETGRCDAPRVNIPLRVSSANLMLDARRDAADRDDEESGRGGRKRRRVDGDGSRQTR